MTAPGRLRLCAAEVRCGGALWRRAAPWSAIGQTSPVRWDSLFDDLAGQFDARLEAERAQDAVDDERLRVARLTLRDRLLALAQGLEAGDRIGLELVTGERIEIVPVEFGADWLAADFAAPVRRYRACVVPVSGITSLLLSRRLISVSLADRAAHPASLSERIGLPMALRDLARRRGHCEITTTRGSFRGTIDRVGRDHLDLAEHDGDIPRRESTLLGTRILRLEDITLVRVAEGR